MKDERTGKDLKEYPVLEDERTYIYVMLNSSGYVKIGKTTNIQQRYQSLSGSNTGGLSIEKVWCSPITYLHSIERVMHIHFAKYRVEGEWFIDSNEVDKDFTFDIAIDYLKSLFSSTEYKRCNEERKRFVEEQRLIGKGEKGYESDK